MGKDVASASFTREQRQRYREKVRADLDVFERMLRHSVFEFDRQLTGMEVELNLVDDDFGPRMANAEVLEAIEDEAYQTELARYNIEINLPPRPLPGAEALELEEQLRASLNAAEKRSRAVGSHILMIGILPTVMPEHFEDDWMSANVRYQALNDAVLAARGEDVYLDIEGAGGERVNRYADSLAPESACTSVQLHLQVEPHHFASYWNAAQVLAGPQLAVGANSPFFFGKQLWHETRIELFTQAADTRSVELKNQGVRPPGLLRRALDHLDLRPLRGERALLPGAAAGAERRGPARRSRGRGRARAGRAAAAQRHGLPLEPADLRHRRRPPAPARREPRAAGRPEHPRRHGQLGVLLRRAADARDRGPAGVDPDELHGGRGELLRRAPATGSRRASSGPAAARCPATELVLRHLLPMADEGLARWGVAQEVRDRYLSIIEGRCLTGVNGATWQIEAVRRLEARGLDRPAALREMLRALRRADAGQPAGPRVGAALGVGERRTRGWVRDGCRWRDVGWVARDLDALDAHSPARTTPHPRGDHP